MWLEIILSFFGFVVLIIGIIITVKLHKDEGRLDLRINAPLLEIKAERIKPFTNGYADGKVKTQLPRKNGLTYVEFYPEDVEQGETIKRPDLQRFCVREEFIRRNAEGQHGARRQKIVILPRDKKDLPKDLRNTLIGDELTKEGQLAWLESTFKQAIPSGDEAIAEMMKNYARGEISKDVLARWEEIRKKERQIQQVTEPTHIPEKITNP